MGKEAPQVVCPGAVWALPSSSSLQLWTEAVAPSFYSSPLILSTARLGKGECGGGQPAEMGAGLHGFCPGSLLGGSLPSFTCT